MRGGAGGLEPAASAEADEYMRGENRVVAHLDKSRGRVVLTLQRAKGVLVAIDSRFWGADKVVRYNDLSVHNATQKLNAQCI
jgi:hypothetical protein